MKRRKGLLKLLVVTLFNLTIQQCTLEGRMNFKWLKLSTIQEQTVPPKPDIAKCFISKNTIFNSKFFFSPCQNFLNHKSNCPEFDVNNMNLKQINKLRNSMMVYYDDSRPKKEDKYIFMNKDNFIGIFPGPLNQFSDKEDQKKYQLNMMFRTGKDTETRCIQTVFFVKEQKEPYIVRREEGDKCSYYHFIQIDKGNPRVIRGLDFIVNHFRAYILIFLILPTLFFHQQELELRDHFFDGLSAYLGGYLTSFFLENILRIFGIRYGKSNSLLVTFLPTVTAFLCGFRIRKKSVRNFLLCKNFFLTFRCSFCSCGA